METIILLELITSSEVHIFSVIYFISRQKSELFKLDLMTVILYNVLTYILPLVMENA